VTASKVAAHEIPSSMHAIRLHPPGGSASIAYEDIRTPQPRAGEALVRVVAAAITRGELDWPVDRLPATPSYEFSGVVVGVADEVIDLRVGDRVYALSPFDRDGAAAQYVVVPASVLAPMPQTLGFVESAAVPLAALSAWQGLLVHGRLVHGQRVLIHGGAGGVGSYAVQLAHQRGAFVITTVSAAHVQTTRLLGADQVIDHTTTAFEDVIDKVDLVFDTVGGERLEHSLAVLTAAGRLVSVAEEPSRKEAAPLEISALYFVVEPNRGQLLELATLIDAGHIRPIIEQVVPLAEAKSAFERSDRRHGPGKIVLRVANDGK
jgi:NADPH:quinone reductase-like Zn-dependent oxidoreductase